MSMGEKMSAVNNFLGLIPELDEDFIQFYLTQAEVASCSIEFVHKTLLRVVVQRHEPLSKIQNVLNFLKGQASL
jgi:hypothetical protein